MNKFTIPHALPTSKGLLPIFRDRFSGWHLGMGLAQNISALLPGLEALSNEYSGCKEVAYGMALWGMQAHPLAPQMAQWGTQYIGKGLQADPKLRCLMQQVAVIPSIGEHNAADSETWYALARQDDVHLILRFLTVVLGDKKQGLAWLGYCWQDLLFLGKPALSKAALDMIQWDTTTAPLKERMEAEWAFYTLPPQDALPKVLNVNESMWGLWRAYTAAELMLRLGRKGEAKGILAQLWKILPWHINMTLKLSDLFQPALSATGNLDNVAILAYSWNKAELFAKTLESLEQSDIGSAHIYTLNNGSTDRTAEVLLQAQNRFGTDRFHIETLPVNIGAPGARNWLLSLPEVQKADWAVFLDDDVQLPANWLRTLLGAVKDKNEIGAVGCRITAATSPYGLQSADYNLIPTPPPPPQPNELPQRVLLFDNCAGSTDNGLFTYTRPCLSVSGCCHAINMTAIRKVGGFDLRYTPSQFDDLDRDIRSALAGMPALYVGGLAIRHVQHSSLAKSQTAKQIGHVMGNKYKLDTKYSDEELISLGKANKALLWNDLETKHAFLIDRLGLTP